MNPGGSWLFGTPEPGYRRTWPWAVVLLVPVLMVGAQVLYLLPVKMLGLISADNIESYPYILHLIIGAFAAAAWAFSLWIRGFERRDLASAGLGLVPRWPILYLRGCGYGLLMGAAVVAAVRVLGGYVVESEVLLTAADLVPIVVLLFAFVLQAGTEEFVFRGWMMGRLAERYGLWVAVIGNSLLFTVMHIDMENLKTLGIDGILIFTITTLLFSIFLSLLVIRERSIWGAAGWHAAWNWMFITCFGLPTTGLELGLPPLLTDYMPAPEAGAWLTGGGDGPEGSIFTPLVLLIASVLVLRRRAPA